MPGVEELPIKYDDIMRGLTHRMPVSYSNLSQYVREKIDEVDLTTHELLEQVIIQVKILNLYAAETHNKILTEEDIDLEWL